MVESFRFDGGNLNDPNDSVDEKCLFDKLRPHGFVIEEKSSLIRMLLFCFFVAVWQFGILAVVLE